MAQQAMLPGPAFLAAAVAVVVVLLLLPLAGWQQVPSVGSLAHGRVQLLQAPSRQQAAALLVRVGGRHPTAAVEGLGLLRVGVDTGVHLAAGGWGESL